MATLMDVSVVAAEREVWRGEAEMVVARSSEGEFAILNGHIPFLAALVAGRVAVVSGDDREEFFVPGGFLEASRSCDAGPQNERGAGSAGPQNERGAGSAGPQNERGAGSAGPQNEHGYHVIVLADDAEELDSIDLNEAKRRFEEAQRQRAEDSDERAEARMRIEMARVEIAQSRGR